MCNDSSSSVLVLACSAPEQYALINSLSKKFTIAGIILESRAGVLRRVFLRRVRRLGIFTVINQLIFKIPDVFRFKPVAASRACAILGEDISFDAVRFNDMTVRTASVNSPEALALVRKTLPDIVVVSGVSILENELLEALSGIPIMNVHCGITPRYRGAHGAFWAIVNRDWDNIGVTIHFIDSGVDTGEIIMQENISVEADDNPRTLALKQNAVGIRMVEQAILDIRLGKTVAVQRPDLDSRMYSSPTMTAYMRFKKNMEEHFRSSTCELK